MAVLLVCQGAKHVIPEPCFHRHIAIDHSIKHRKGPRGFSLCRWCGDECENGRRTFCRRADCLHQFSMRSNGGYMRGLVEKRDKGICTKCGFDTEKALMEIRMSRASATFQGSKWVMPTAEQREKEKAAIARYIAMGFPAAHYAHWWEAEHVIPVIEGGGCCGLENMTTLCIPCHKSSTRALASRRKKKSRRPDLTPELFTGKTMSSSQSTTTTKKKNKRKSHGP